MAKQDKYDSAYSPKYGKRIHIQNAYMSKHCDWLFECLFKVNGEWKFETFAENQLINYKEKEECQPLTMLQVID